VTLSRYYQLTDRYLHAGHTSNARHRRRHRIQSKLASKLDGEVVSAESDTASVVVSQVDVISAAVAPSVVISTEQSLQENAPRKTKQNSSKLVSILFIVWWCYGD